MAWARNGTPNTLSGASATLTISDLSGVKSNVVFSHTFRSSGTTATYFYLNNDNASGNYAKRQAENGVETTRTSQNTVVYDTGGDANDKFSITYIFGISSQEKLAIGFGINRNTAGAGNAPIRGEFVWKWANTTNTIDRIDDNTSAQPGTYAIDSNLSALGSDLTPVAGKTIETGSIYIDTDTNQRYFWNGSSWSLQA